MAITTLNEIQDIAAEFGVALHEAGDMKWYYDNKNPSSPVQPIMDNGKITDWIGYEHNTQSSLGRLFYKFVDFSDANFGTSENTYTAWQTLMINHGYGGYLDGEEIQAIGRIRWANPVDDLRNGIYLFPSNVQNSGLRMKVPSSISHMQNSADGFFCMFAVVNFFAMTSREPILGYSSPRNDVNANSIQSVDKYWATWYGSDFAYLVDRNIVTSPGLTISTNKPFLVMLFGPMSDSLDISAYCVWDFSKSYSNNDFNTYIGGLWSPKSSYYSDVLGKIAHAIGVCYGDGIYMEGVYLRMMGYGFLKSSTDIPNEIVPLIYEQYKKY